MDLKRYEGETPSELIWPGKETTIGLWWDR
jgi:hypothetical protein